MTMRKFTQIILFSFFITTIAFSQNREETLFRNSSIDLTGIWGGSTNGLVEFNNNFSLNNSGYFLFEINNNFLIGWSGYGSGTNLENGDKAQIGEVYTGGKLVKNVKTSTLPLLMKKP